MLKLERGQSSSKISFDDTMDIDTHQQGSAADPDSSDEDNQADNRSDYFILKPEIIRLPDTGWRSYPPWLVPVRTCQMSGEKCLPKVNQSRLATPCQSR